MSIEELSVNDILKIFENSQEYFKEGLDYEIREIGTNLSLFFDLKNCDWKYKSIANIISPVASHRYLIIKIKLNNKIYDYSIGLGYDTDNKYIINDSVFYQSVLYIPDWTMHSEYSNNAPGLNKIKKNLSNNKIYIGTLIKKDKLKLIQVKILLYLHYNIGVYDIIKKKGKEKNLLIKLPFLYSDYGYLFSFNIPDSYIVLNCRDFTSYFDTSYEWLYSLLITNTKNTVINNKELIPYIDYKLLHRYKWKFDTSFWSYELSYNELLDDLIKNKNCNNTIFIDFNNELIIKFDTPIIGIFIIDDFFKWRFDNSTFSNNFTIIELINIFKNFISMKIHNNRKIIIKHNSIIFDKDKQYIFGSTNDFYNNFVKELRKFNIV